MHLLAALRLTIRRLVHSPVVPTIITIALVLGVSASTIMFGVLQATLFNPIHVNEIDRVIVIGGAAKPPGQDWLTWWAQAPSVPLLTIFSSGGADITSSAPRFSSRVSVASVTRNFFRVFDEKPQQGTGFSPVRRSDSPEEVILSYEIWHRLFSSTAPIGIKLFVNNLPATVVGVMPEDFHFPGSTDIWLADDNRALLTTLGRDKSFSQIDERMLGRLADGANISSAETELRTLQNRIWPRDDPRSGVPVQVYTLREGYVSSAKSLLVTLFVMSCLLLLVACSNAGNAITTRILSRRRELAVRLVLGSTNVSLFTLLVMESAVLCTVSGVLGFIVSAAAFVWIRQSLSGVEPYLSNLRMTSLVGLFGLASILVTFLVLAVLSIYHASQRNLLVLLNEPGTTTSVSVSSQLRRSMLFLQLLICFVLVSAEISSVIRLQRLSKQNLGFDPRGLVTESINLPKESYSSIGSFVQFQEYVIDYLTQGRGDVHACVTSRLPLSEGQNLFVSGNANGRPLMSRLIQQEGDCFGVLHIPVLESIQASPNEPTVTINQAMAKQLFQDREALNQYIKIDGEKYPRRVTGLVGDVKMSTPGDKPEAQLYLPYSYPLLSRITQRNMNIILKSDNGQQGLEMASLVELSKVLPENIQVFGRKAGSDLLSQSMLREQTQTRLFLLIAGITLLVASFGLYSSVAFLVEVRTDEIRIRRALGAKTSNIALLVLRESLILTSCALGIGFIFYEAIWRVVASQTFDVPNGTPTTFICSSFVLIAVTLISGFYPVRRAASLHSREFRH